jgi:hypothetical protein
MASQLSQQVPHFLRYGPGRFREFGADVNDHARLVPMLVYHAAGPTEADWIRWVGVTLAIVGTVVAAPKGTLLIVSQTFNAGRWLSGLIRRTMARILRRRRQSVSGLGGVAMAKMSGAGTLSAIGSVWSSSESVEQKIERLRGQIGEVRQAVNEARQEARQNHSALSARLDQEADALRAADKALTDRLEAEGRQAARIDARGVVLIGLSVVLTGIPDGLAAVAWVGWFVIAVAAVFVFCLALWPAFRSATKALASRRSPAQGRT